MTKAFHRLGFSSHRGRHPTASKAGPLALLALAVTLCAGLQTARAQPGGAGSSAPAQPSNLLQFSRNVPGEAKPLTLAADEVFTWQEQGYHVLLLRGHALAQLGIVQARCQQCAVWVDMAGYKARGMWQVTLYGEGQARLDTSNEIKDGERMLLRLTTRGELKITSGRSKVIRQSLATDPVVQRGQALRRPGSSVQQTQATTKPETPATRTSPGEGVERTGFREPQQAPPPAPPVQGPPATSPPLTSPPLTSPPTATPPGTSTSLQPFAPPPPSPPAADGGTSPPPGGEPGVPPPFVPGAPPPLPPPSRPAAPPRPGEEEAPRPRAMAAPVRQYSVSPRSASGFDIKTESLGPDEQAIIVTGGVILNVRNAPDLKLLDIEADRLVIFTRGQNPQQLVERLRQPQGESEKDLEFYLSGNVEIRQDSATGSQVLRAHEVYYDVQRNVAVALKARLELLDPHIPDPVVVQADELFKTSATTYESVHAEVFASRLPSDPGLKVYLTEATIEERTVPQLSLFGRKVIDRVTGLPLEKKQTWVKGRHVFFEANDVPFFYLPYVSGDARDPLGPVENIRMGWNRVFGTQIGVGLNAYDLLGIQPPEGSRWLFDVDYLSERGPALGTRFNYAGSDLFGIPSQYEGLVNANGIYDQGTDLIGGYRPQPFEPTAFRGRLLFRKQVYDLPAGFTFQTQVAHISDRNYLEQYFKREYETGLPQDTYAYVKQQQGSWAWTGVASARLLDWQTQTEWLPRLDGYLLGLSPFDVFTYNSQVGAGYARLRITDDPPPTMVISPTDVATDTGRVNWFQELSLPFSAGDLRVVPYAKMDLAAYSSDLDGDSSGRIWGGGGVRTSLPMTRLYPDIQSELFNVNGINHKIVFRGNYFYADSSEPYTTYPQLDRLNDAVSDQQVREIRVLYPAILPKAATALVSPLYDPQVYAIRRLVDNRIDTLNAIEVAELGIQQRWQTKRGYPGAQHIIDWMTLDLSTSLFPNKQRDNFGKTAAFMEYDWSWNIGDRTTLVSNGWVDPINQGPRVYNVGAFFSRPDRTSAYLGYRQIDPLSSKAVIGSVSYVFSPKYALTATTMYDFGTSIALSNALIFTRMGKDVQVSVGLTYDALQNNVGALVQIVPNLIPANRRPGFAAVSPQGP